MRLYYISCSTHGGGEGGFECSGIDDRFEYRSHLPACLSDPIELAAGIIAAANQGADEARLRLDGDQGPLGSASFGSLAQTVIDTCQSHLKGPLRSVLQACIQGGEDGEIIGGQIFNGIALQQLLAFLYAECCTRNRVVKLEKIK